MRPSATFSRKAIASLAVTVPLALVACGKTPEVELTPAPETTTTTATTASETTAPETTASETTVPETSVPETTAPETSVPETTAPETTTSTRAKKIDEAVAQAYEMFQPLAQDSLFEEFTACDPAGLKDSFNCTGPEVGQVQFFKSASKASQTTQLLTELRSSKVIKDDGDRVIGWSTLGTTAILTVVDNSKGLVMQQMISTDQVDPEEKLKELGVLD